MSEKTATDRLRELLDERGVEHTDAEDGHTQHTWWSDGDHEIAASNSGKRLAVYNLTPEQAIAATVGAGMCEVEIIDTGNEAAYEHYEHIMHCNHCNHEYGYVQYDEDGYTWMDEPPKFCPNCGAKVLGE